MRLTDEQIKDLKEIVKNFNKLEGLPNCYISNLLYQCFIEVLLDTVETLLQDVDQHINWNRTQNERLIDIHEENKKLRETLGQARQALEHIHPRSEECLKLRRDALQVINDVHKG